MAGDFSSSSDTKEQSVLPYLLPKFLSQNFGNAPRKLALHRRRGSDRDILTPPTYNSSHILTSQVSLISAQFHTLQPKANLHPSTILVINERSLHSQHNGSYLQMILLSIDERQILPLNLTVLIFLCSILHYNCVSSSSINNVISTLFLFVHCVAFLVFLNFHSLLPLEPPTFPEVQNQYNSLGGPSPRWPICPDYLWFMSA